MPILAATRSTCRAICRAFLRPILRWSRLLISRPILAPIPRHLCVAAALFVSCKKSDPATPAKPPEAIPAASPGSTGSAPRPSENQPPKISPTDPCPDAPAINAILRTALKPDDPASVGLYKCTPGRFPVPGWAVELRADGELRRVAIDAKSHRLIASADPFALGGGDLKVWRLEAIDFDGDGTDEILDEISVDHRGVFQTWLSVLHRNGDGLAQALRIATGYDNEGEAGENSPKRQTYNASTTVSPPGPDRRRTLSVNGNVTRGSQKGWRVGHAVLRWKDGELTSD